MSIDNLPPVVLDTNVLISAAILSESISAKALFHALRHFELVQSETTWSELIEVITRPKLRRYFDDETRNKFLELALDVDAAIIVSGDIHLISLNPYRGITISNPAGFLLSHVRG